jgi:outer membrane protein assembly factor BamB
MRTTARVGFAVAIVLSAATAGFAQGRGGGAWTTVGADAQRTGSVRSDPKISVASMQKPGFQFLWKRQLDAQPLTQPLLLPNIIAYKGFKALAFVASASGGVYSIDYELNRMFWEQKLPASAAASSGAACASRLPAITRVTPVAVPVAGARGGAGGGGRGRGAGAPQIANGRGGNDNLFVIGRDGWVHIMNPQVGTDQIPPVKFLPPNANISGSILVDNVLYATTTGSCGGVANGVWAVDLAAETKPVTSYDAKGAAVAGSASPTFGTDGTLYIATGSGNSPVANAIVSLEARTLAQKDWFSAGASPFTSHPIVFQHKGKDLVLAANKDGRLYVLDSASMGGADHSTPLHRSVPLAGSSSGMAGLATWQDQAGTRWVVAAVDGTLPPDSRFPMNNGTVSKGALAAFTVVDQNDVPTLQPQWVSRDLPSPVAPAVVNGVVFALASGEARGSATGAAQKPRPSSSAVLYAIDGATGKELWTSGTTITSSVHGIGPSAGDSQVYVVTRGGTLYTFGMPAER